MQSKMLKWSNGNKSETSCKLILKASRENVERLQVRGNIGSKNRLLVKHMILLRNYAHNGYLGRSTHDSIIERFS